MRAATAAGTWLASSARGRMLAISAGAALLAGAGLTGGLGATAARAALVVAALGALAAVARRRGRLQVDRPVLTVLARQGLSRDTGLAVVAVDGRRLLVGFGGTGVTLVAELDASQEGAAP